LKDLMDKCESFASRFEVHGSGEGQMTYIRTVALVLVVFVVQNGAMSARVSGSRHHESQSSRVSTVAGQLSDRVRAEVSTMRAGLRADAEALLQAVDPQEKRRLIEKLGDSDSDSVRDLFADLVTKESIASVRLDLINYLIRNPRPDLQPVFERLAASDPD